MKKQFWAILLVLCIAFTSFACFRDSNLEEAKATFNSFNNSKNYALLTCFELIVQDEHYNREDIKYCDKETEILCLTEQGFYSYAYDNENLFIDFLFTTYDFTTTLLGQAEIPSKIINSFFKENCFWLRMDDPQVSKFKQIYFVWDIQTKTNTIVDGNAVSIEEENAIDNNKGGDFSYNIYYPVFKGDYIYITEKNTNEKKVVDKSILNTFEEGLKIRDFYAKNFFEVLFDFNRDMFIIDAVYTSGRDVYFVNMLLLGFLGDPMYCYVIKWDFDTEECSYFTCVYFEYYQEWVTDFVVLNNN